MLAMFLDQGPGFISDDTAAVLAQLPCRLIHGAKAYLEGHGKLRSSINCSSIGCYAAWIVIPRSIPIRRP